ncbi:MAG: hypothetical protein U0X91_25085 [Spirosomataceae bacterium]
MKKLIVFAFLVAFISSCRMNGVDSATEAVPQNVSNAVRKAYPEATDLKFTELETNRIWLSEFVVNIQKMSAVVNNTGQITETYNVARVGATLPESAQKYINTNYPNATIISIDEQINDQKKVIGYKVLIKTKEGKEVVMLFDTTGSLMLLIAKDGTPTTKPESTTTTYAIEQKDLPEAIKKVLTEKHGEYKYIKGVVMTENGKKTYHVVVGKEMVNYEYVFDENGTILKSGSSGMTSNKTQKEMGAKDVPAKAKEYLDKTYKTWDYMKGLIFYENDKITGYLAVVKSEGKLYYVYFDATGGYLKSTTETVVETPASAVQEKAIEAKDILGNSKEYLTKNYTGWVFLKGVAKFKENKIYQYLIAIKVGDNIYYVTFDGEGKFLEAKKG